MLKNTFSAVKLSDVVFIMQINVKMPTIVVGILTNNGCWHFNIYEHDQFHDQLSWAGKRFYDLEARLSHYKYKLCNNIFHHMTSCLGVK